MLLIQLKNRKPKFGQIETRMNGNMFQFRTIVPFDNYFFTIGTGIDIITKASNNPSESAAVGFINQTEWTDLTDNPTIASGGMNGNVGLYIALF